MRVKSSKEFALILTAITYTSTKKIRKLIEFKFKYSYFKII